MTESCSRHCARCALTWATDTVLMADLCLCEYTDHGHCGPLTADGSTVDNDVTLMRYASVARAQVEAGADVVAPSGMMDGQVGVIRDAIDSAGYADRAILAYAAKYASAFYGPFRDAAESTPSFGDRRGYQMDPANGDEAMREVFADLEQGADCCDGQAGRSVPRRDRAGRRRGRRAGGGVPGQR